jgi:hypothetical protein
MMTPYGAKTPPSTMRPFCRSEASLQSSPGCQWGRSGSTLPTRRRATPIRPFRRSVPIDSERRRASSRSTSTKTPFARPVWSQFQRPIPDLPAPGPGDADPLGWHNPGAVDGSLNHPMTT